MKTWWDGITQKGPAYGYEANMCKTWIIEKNESLEKAQDIFNGSGVRITSTGMRHLGAALGNESFVREYVNSNISEWCDQIQYLSKIAISHPHEAYAAYTHRLMRKWNYIFRTIPDISHMLVPLERSIHQNLLPALTGQDTFNIHMRSLMSLPVHDGGLGISNPTEVAQIDLASENGASSWLSVLPIKE